MSRKVADVLWEMLADAGVKRCYGIVGDALNPVVDALRRNGKIEFIHVRNEEYGAFAAVAEAYLTGNPVAVCGTAGPGVVHLFNGLMDARKEGAPVIAIAGDVETSVMDTAALEEINPYKFFDTASLYTARLVNPEQARAIIHTDSGRRRVVRCGHPLDPVHDSGATRFAPLRCRPQSACEDDRRRENGSDFWGRWLQRCPRRGGPASGKIKGPRRLCVPRQAVARTRQSECGWHDRPPRLRRSL
jgi:hypothetical protein